MKIPALFRSRTSLVVALTLGLFVLAMGLLSGTCYGSMMVFRYYMRTIADFNCEAAFVFTAGSMALVIVAFVLTGIILYACMTGARKWLHVYQP